MNRSTEPEEQINILLSGLEQIIWLLCYFYGHFKILMTCFVFFNLPGNTVARSDSHSPSIPLLKLCITTA